MHESDALFLIRIAPKGFTYFDHFARSLARIERHQRRILRKLGDIQQGDDEEFTIVSKELDDLKREVAESKTVTQGAAALVASLADQIRDAKDDPEALEQLANELDANTKALADAVQANTPFQPSGNT